MILFPAIDLKDGVCVRLEQGDPTRSTVFHRDPAAQARAFELQGFEFLHLVDLDGAFAGRPMNSGAVERILEAVKVTTERFGRAGRTWRIAPDYDVDDVAAKVVNAIVGYTDYVNRTVWRRGRERWRFCSEAALR